MFYWRFYKNRMIQFPGIKRPIFVLSIMNFVLSITAVVFALVSKYTLDAVLDSDNSIFIRGAIGLVLIILFQLFFKILNQRYFIYHQSDTHRMLQNRYFDSLMHTEIPIINSKHNGAWMNNLDSDVNRLTTGLIDVLPRFVFMLSRFALSFVLLAFLDLTMALIITGSGLIIYLFGITFKGEMKRRHHKRQDAESDVRSFLQEHLDHMEVIKAFEAEDYTKNQLGTRQDAYMSAKIHQQKLTIGVGNSVQALFMVVYAGMLILGAYRISLGFISIGSLVAILQLVQYLQSPFKLANTILPAFTAMEGSFERLMAIELLEKEPSNQSPLQPFDQLVVSNLTFGYSDQDIVINNLNTTMIAGQTIQIGGSSGIGKTTLLHLLLGLLKPTNGSLELLYKDNRKPIDSTTRSYFSYVPQRVLLKSGSIRENIIYNRDSISEELLIQICILCEIHKDITLLENGYDTQINEHGLGLSEGQLQRLAIARALVGNEPIILLDEITSALDQDTEKKILSNITSKLNKTIIIISHRDLPSHMVDSFITL